MSRNTKSIATALALAAGLWIAQPALSASGSGGGGASMPSSSAPEYDPVAEYQKGIQAFEGKDFKAAATAFKRVVSVAPSHTPAQYLLGASYLQLDEFKKAKKPLEAAVKAEPGLIEARRDLGVTQARLGDAAKAGEQRAALATIKAACTAPCASEAKLDAALAAIDGALAGAPPVSLAPPNLPGSARAADPIYVAAVGLINEGRYDEAIAALEHGLWAAGPHPELLTYLGFANRKLKRFETARGWYEAALAVAPEHRGALEYYGELKLELGDIAGARNHLARLDAICTFGCQQADELRLWLRERVPSAS